MMVETREYKHYILDRSDLDYSKYMFYNGERPMRTGGCIFAKTANIPINTVRCLMMRQIKDSLLK
jgi:hypothetical protein